MHPDHAAANQCPTGIITPFNAVQMMLRSVKQLTGFHGVTAWQEGRKRQTEKQSRFLLFLHLAWSPSNYSPSERTEAFQAACLPAANVNVPSANTA